MKCPNCGNTNPDNFIPSKQDYMSAFTVDNPIVRCKYCGKEFESTSVTPLKDVKMGTSEGVYHSKRKFESYPLPPLDPKKASKEMLETYYNPVKPKEIKPKIDWVKINEQRNLKSALDLKRKEAEMKAWATKEKPASLYEKQSYYSKEYSAYNPAKKPFDKKQADARAWAAEKNKIEFAKRGLIAPMQPTIKSTPNLDIMPNVFGPALTEADIKKSEESKSRERIEEYKKKLRKELENEL